MRYAKYILLITLLVFACSSATGLAAASRYENIVTEDAVVAQFDTTTLRYEKDPYRDEKLVSVWIKSTSDFSYDYTLKHYLFRLNERQMLLMDTVDYSSNGQALGQTSNEYNPILWTPVLPETVQEASYTAALKYAQTNNARLQLDYDQRMHNPKRTPFSILTDIFNAVSNNS
jgi:hypothetical protein